MKIEVRLFATFRKYLPENAQGQRAQLDLPEGMTVKQVLEQLKVPLDTVKLVFVNSVHADLDQVLKEGDVLGAFPPVAGG